jgi:predicted molibdopterin-dependent oxidoreductase YjgC
MTELRLDGAESPTVTMDGDEVGFKPGETLYEIAKRRRAEVPTLCFDDRLDPFGGCRLCVVEIEGYRNPVASCTTKAQPGMVVLTRTDRLEKHRKTLLELVRSENPRTPIDALRGMASQELAQLERRYEVTGERFQGKKSGRSKDDDKNPFIFRDYDQCISCYRCVRVCAEQEGDHAISTMNRGFKTQITTEFNGLLEDSACTFCGQCVQTCPTGALGDAKAMRAESLPGEVEATRSVCCYCGVGCSVDLLSKGDKLIGVRPAMDGPANEGALCVKGQFAFDFVQHEARLKTPLVRDGGKLREASWDEALQRAADGFKQVLAQHGRHSIYAVASGRAPHESAYTLQKFIRAGFGTNYIDNCSRA